MRKLGLAGLYISIFVAMVALSQVAEANCKPGIIYQPGSSCDPCRAPLVSSPSGGCGCPSGLIYSAGKCNPPPPPQTKAGGGCVSSSVSGGTGTVHPGKTPRIAQTPQDCD